MTPDVASTRRTRLFEVSAIQRLPAESKVTSDGDRRAAAVAGPLSPVELAFPFPATVVMIPVAAATRRILLLAVSAMSRFPELSNETFCGLFSAAAVA